MSRHDWMDHAACATHAARLGKEAVDWFFPEAGSGRGTYDTGRAICAGCPVRAECADYAINGDGSWRYHGLWGGLTPDQRRQLERPIRHVARCGTTSGYERHREKGEPACSDCRDAKRAYTARRRGAA